MQNNCDGSGPHTDGVIKLMPTGGGGNMTLCKSCWAREIAKRAERNAKMRFLSWDLPTWESGKVYET